MLNSFLGSKYIFFCVVLKRLLSGKVWLVEILVLRHAVFRFWNIKFKQVLHCLCFILEADNNSKSFNEVKGSFRGEKQ